MINFFTYLLILVLLFELSVLKQRIKWGGQYWIGTYLGLNRLSQALEVLGNASIGSYFTLSLKKGSHKFILLKNQDSREWWFEVLINPNKKFYFSSGRNKISFHYYADIFNELLKVKDCSSNIQYKLPKNIPKFLKKYRRFGILNDTQMIIDLFIEYFKNNFKATEDDKVYISFYNTYVEKGIEV